MDERRNSPTGSRGRRESEVLLTQLDGHLARLSAGSDGAELVLAERIAKHLRMLISETIRASAVDRARVRAAVHYFVVRRDSRHPRPTRPTHVDVWVVNDIIRDLGRHDLLIPEPTLV